MFYFIIFQLLLIFLFWLIWFLFNKAWQKGLLFSSLNFVLLEIRFPKVLESTDIDKEKEKLLIMEQFYNSLGSILHKEKGLFSPKPYLVFEIAVPEKGEEIGFYFALPKKFQYTIARQIQGFFPEAEIETVNDFNIFNRQGIASGSVLKIKRNYVLPFQTYKKLEASTLGLITNAISSLKEKGEGIALQILVRPAKYSSKGDAIKVIKHLYNEKKIDDAIEELEKPDSFIDSIKNFINIKKSEDKNKLPELPKTLTPLSQELINAIDNKAKQNLFEINIRILVSAETEEETEQILSNVESAFAQFESPDLNSFYSFRPQSDSLKKLVYNFSFRLFNKKETVWLSAEELTSVFHWPIIKIETPKVRFLKAKAAGPPAILPNSGIILGKNQFRGQETTIKLNPLDRRQHLHIIGQTGAGKSYLLKNLIKQDIDSGAGVGIIDPHEDLIEAVLEFVPRSRHNNTIIYDATDKEHTIDFDDIINNEKILFVKNGFSFGPIIITKLHTAAIKRAERLGRLPQRDFYLYYMDDFNDSAANSIATILSEFKKYHINFTLIDVCADQLTKENRDLILSNVGSLVSFRVDPEDAKYLVKYFEPTFNESDLINIDNKHAYVKLLINGAITVPFNIAIEEIISKKV